MTQMGSSNPLGLTTEYTWQSGDTMMLVAYKYRRPERWLELLDLNKDVLMRNRYLMKEGDIIKVPQDWFPLPAPPAFTTKFKGSSGTRVVADA